MIKIFYTLCVLVFSINAPIAEDRVTGYIDMYHEIAILEMYRTGVPASITLAQALVESNAGRSDLASNANNHFGIKCKSTWVGDTYYHKDDDLDINGNLIPSCFRAYETDLDSYIDHSNFLRYKSNYQPLFLLDKYDYKSWAYGLKEAGYATDVSYAHKLIAKIEELDLDKYDRYENPNKKLLR